MGATIELIDAAAGYGRAPVFEGLSLEVAAGTCLAVAGPNGAGKTTLLRALVGVLPLWRGEITIDGKSLTTLDTEQRIGAGLVLCPEGRKIFSTLTVEENLRLGATVLDSSVGRAERRRRVSAGLERAYAMFPILRERRHGLGGALSGGQQQMLAIARALMSEPSLLMLDEPSLGLAPRIVDQLYDHLAGLRATGLTMIVVEESAARVSDFADRALILRNGMAVLSGKASEVASDPRLRQAYIGTA